MNLDDVRAVLFDMDGTLVDSDAVVERAWRGWAERNGLDADEVHAHAQGVPGVVTVRRFLPGADEATVRAHADAQLAFERANLAGVVPTRGAHRLLDLVAAREIAWVVVTSADTALARARLAHCGIEPPLLVTVDDVTRGKPDPEGYLLAARRLEVDPARCLVVEDTDAGIAAGRSAGAQVAALKGRPGDLRINDLDQLADLWEPAPAR